ncbi:DUF6283 family protein [Nocardia neocaledoniensis]|uniref:DUF6283 family protein n=1 Tax=Nocardia neocaledoniensis TaxID=236511 RepID=UPI001C98F1F8|nr:DUF6283 family protein [Nocardia neocaledoniensis]
MGPPAPRPCVSCPYRRDVPSGVWELVEYEKLRAYAGDMGVQAPHLFQCHQTDAGSRVRRMCAGWVGCHGGGELLALRLALIQSRIGLRTFEQAQGHEPPVPLFTAGGEAAEHGQRDFDQPGLDAQLAIRKVARTRSDLSMADPGLLGSHVSVPCWLAPAAQHFSVDAEAGGCGSGAAAPSVP